MRFGERVGRTLVALAPGNARLFGNGRSDRRREEARSSDAGNAGQAPVGLPRVHISSVKR